MAVSVKEKKDNLVVLEAKLAKEDYKDKVEKEIKNLSKNASMKGFRKGHTPQGLVRKMYGESVRIDVIQSLISDEINKFVRDEKYLTIGQPIPLRDLDQSKAFEGDDVTLAFELALIPEIKNKLGSGDTLDYYKPVITEEAAKEELKKVMQSNKQPVSVDTVDENAIVYGTLAELDGDSPKEGGIKIEKAMLFPNFIKNEEEKAKFVGAAKDTLVVFSPFKAFEGDKAEISSLLKIEKDDVEKYEASEFSYQITEISSIKDPDLNQEFFDRVFGEDTVHSEEEAIAKLKENLQKEEEGNANFKFVQDLKNLIHETKLGDMELAEDTIRAWFNTTDNASAIEDSTDPDDSFKKMIDSLKEDLFFNEYAKEYDIKVAEEDVKNYAIRYTWQQFANMGWANAPMEILEKQAEELLKNQNFVYGTEQDILRQLVAQKLRENNVVTVVEKEITPDELHKLILPENAPVEESEEAAN